MRDIEEVLREKQFAIEQVRREIEALNSVTPLLSDGRPDTAPEVSARVKAESADELKEALRTVAALLVDDTDEFDPAVRARLIEAGEVDSQRHRPNMLSRQLKHLAGPLLGRRDERERSRSAFP